MASSSRHNARSEVSLFRQNQKIRPICLHPEDEIGERKHPNIRRQLRPRDRPCMCRKRRSIHVVLKQTTRRTIGENEDAPCPVEEIPHQTLPGRIAMARGTGLSFWSTG